MLNVIKNSQFHSLENINVKYLNNFRVSALSLSHSESPALQSYAQCLRCRIDILVPSFYITILFLGFFFSGF